MNRTEEKSNMANTVTVFPPVLWAQRKEKVILTVQVEDAVNPTVELDENQITFRAVGGADKKEFAVTIQFYKAVIPEESKRLITSRHVYFEIKKKDKDDSFWPRLTKDAMKFHWLKTDFELWQDEDDSDAENAEPDLNLEEMMQSMGGLGGAGGAGDIPPGDEEEEDSDDENMPDLE